jgi:hypothetical protein
VTTPHQLSTLLLLAAVIGTSASALAQPTTESGTLDQCVELNTRAQEFRRLGQFAQARVKLLACIQSNCPALLLDDCTERLDALERAQPTVVFDVRDATGQDLSKVSVSVDNKPWATELDGRALSVDPGQHSFTFEDKLKGTHVTKTFVLREGEKARHERILLDKSSPPGFGASSAASGQTLPGNTDGTAWNGWQIASAASLGAGLFGLGTGAAAAWFAHSKAKDANAYCPETACSDNHAVRMSQDARVAGNVASVAIGLGAVGLAAAVTCYFVGSPGEAETKAALTWTGNAIHIQGTW